MQHRRKIQRARLAAVEAVNGRGMSEGARTNPDVDVCDVVGVAADTERRLHRSGGDRRYSAPGVRAQAALRRRVPAEDGRALRVRSLHCQSR